MQADGLSQQAKSPSMVLRRVDSRMLVRGASCVGLILNTQKNCTGRRAILGLVLAVHVDVPCNMLAERGAKKPDGWGLGSSAAEWSIRPSWRGTDATKSRDEECAPESSVVRTYLEGVVRVGCARRPTGRAPAISLMLWSLLEEEGRSLH